MQNPPSQNLRSTKKTPVAAKIVGIYLLVGCLWIFFSDQFLSHLLQDSLTPLTQLQTLKGWVYVIATASMLYWLIRRETRVSHHATTTLKHTLAELQVTQDTLKQSEERFRSFMDHNPAASWITDVEGRVEYVSRTYTTLFQVTPDLIGQSIFDLYPQEIAQTYLNNIQAVAKSGQMLETLEPGIRADGHPGQFLVYKFPLPQPDGSMHVGGVAIDVTDRKRAEAALKWNEEHLRLAFDFAQIGSWDWDLLTNQLTWNRNHFFLLGLNPETDIASYENWRACVHPDEVTQIEVAINTALANQASYIEEYRVIHPDGSLHWVLGKGQAIYDKSGHPIRMVGVLLDTTNYKRLEHALRRQAERLELTSTIAQRIRQSLNLKEILNTTVVEVKHLLQVERVIVYQFAPDMSGTIVAEAVAPGCRVSLGDDIEDTCFQSESGIDYLQGKKRAIANVDEAGLTDCHLALLKQFEVKANLVVPIVLVGTSEKAPGHLWGLLIAHQCAAPREWHPEQLDLLEQIALQLAIAIQQAQIFEQAQTELVEREQAEIRLRAALAEKEVLLKEIHHRVKNNLQIVSGLLQLQAQGIDDPRMVNALRESQNRVEAMSLIHKRLYTSSDLGQIDAADYIQSLATSLLTTYQISPGRITLEVEVEPVILNLDQAIPCGLIVNELVSNALKYAFPDARLGKINIKLCLTNANFELTIQDNGIGLPSHLDWRNAQSLGLSLVYALATEQLEGSLVVDHNQGTKFTIKFPQSPT